MKIAIVGATGEVGRMMLTCLEEYKIEADIDLYASERSAGSTVYFNDEAITVKKLDDKSLATKYDYILMSAGGAVSKHYSPIAQDAENIVIDNSSAFRREQNIPLVVPEINPHELMGYRGIIANPNCSTIQMVLALQPLHLAYGLKKVVVSTYQSVSGSGHKGIQTLENQRQGSRDLGSFPERIDLNVIPQIGAFLDNGYSQEEDKMQFETCRIMGINDLQVCATTVRVPVFYGHSEAVYAEFEREIELSDAVSRIKQFPSVVYHENTYITPLGLNKSNDSHVCRLRYGVDSHSLSFWNVGNNVRLGAATNAVRIMIKHIELNS
jgi:aspartate-semialdehyde dehydrogenase